MLISEPRQADIEISRSATKSGGCSKAFRNSVVGKIYTKLGELPDVRIDFLLAVELSGQSASRSLNSRPERTKKIAIAIECATAIVARFLPR